MSLSSCDYSLEPSEFWFHMVDSSSPTLENKLPYHVYRMDGMAYDISTQTIAFYVDCLVSRVLPFAGGPSQLREGTQTGQRETSSAKTIHILVISRSVKTGHRDSKFTIKCYHLMLNSSWSPPNNHMPGC